MKKKTNSLNNRINGKRFEAWVFGELVQKVTPAIVLPLKDLTKGEQFTDILIITKDKIIGMECKLTVEDTFTVSNIRQVVKLKNLNNLNPQGRGYVVVHLKYEGEFKKELIRVADLNSPEIRILTWEEVLNEINSK